ncbi:MAG TPA: YqzL family protein [Clostridia bacterium]
MFFGDDLTGMSWNLFTSTGQIGYYLLFKRLSEQNDIIDGVNPPSKRTLLD